MNVNDIRLGQTTTLVGVIREASVIEGDVMLPEGEVNITLRVVLDRQALGGSIFEALADRLGEHPKAHNAEVANSGEYETLITLRGESVETLAEYLTPAVLAVVGQASADSGTEKP